ncbi:hypothetical protein TPA0910_13580 [Streptomyces hygroscopicus subsp. sporocinereus]|uniref:NADP-dependent oxidoreductase domain-containing protein n=1 Tax=Streptomyces hygroscopicus TaxID=1912 RepID=A0ABQ3TUC7_STRHY|nr:aldo/keto reductase [Streptomyces hygroscopicus]GHJ26925.1 hypothetical protein TPA0910_13580 [Streptomyces hygroscopicus]
MSTDVVCRHAHRVLRGRRNRLRPPPAEQAAGSACQLLQPFAQQSRLRVSQRYPVDPRWQPGNFEKNIEAVDRLAELAAAKGATVSQLALAWLLTRGEHIVPTPGTRSPKRVQENAGAADLTLTDTDLKAIAEILPQGGFGARYTEGHVPTWI